MSRETTKDILSLETGETELEKMELDDSLLDDIEAIGIALDDISEIVHKDNFIEPIDGKSTEPRSPVAGVVIKDQIMDTSILNTESDVHPQGINVVGVPEPVKFNPFAGIKGNYVTNWEFCGEIIRAQVHGLAKRMGVPGGVCMLC